YTITHGGYDYKGQPNNELTMGDATFVKKSLQIENHDEIYITGNENSFEEGLSHTFPCKATVVVVNVNGKSLVTCNVHGTALSLNKLDDPNRLEQSRKILGMMNQYDGEKIIVGDFNLLPETQSIKMFENEGYKNLIKDFAIKTTRGTLMRQLHPEYEKGLFGFQEFADYAFTTPGISINKFEVPDVPVSDHLPLILEFNL
ncbi:MAG TPA: hypothetical protein VHQ20_01175, partial [Patescibacteria group bacterium]|nr:hypothetical protein [Patescibacteria group bacterium]